MAKDVQLVFATLIADATGMRAMRLTGKNMVEFAKKIRRVNRSQDVVDISIDEKFINQYLQLITQLPKRMQKRIG